MIAICFVFIVVLICAHFSDKQAEKFRHEERMAMIKAGLLPPEEAEGGR